jgi:hypothetical protein
LSYKFITIISYEFLQIKELKAALGPLSCCSEKYCSEACLTRYLEARNWNVTKSKKMLEESLKWREAYRPEDIRWVSLIFLYLFFLLIMLVKLTNTIFTGYCLLA